MGFAESCVSGEMEDFHSGGMVLGKTKLLLVLKNKIRLTRGDLLIHDIWPFALISGPYLAEKSISSEI